MPQRSRIMFVGGGTGGHFYPLIAIAETLNALQSSPELYYIGPDPYDSEALAEERIQFVRCPAGKTRRYHSLRNFFDIFKTFYGFLIALLKLYQIYPDVVVSKGGYTSVPVVLAAAFLNIPIIVHESDAVAGRANRLAAHFARYIAVSYPHKIAEFPETKTILTGIPIRRELITGDHPNARALIGVESDLPMILVLGGSQGAERLNHLILESLDDLLPRFEIVHQTGDSHFEKVVHTAKELVRDEALVDRYHPVAFLSSSLLSSAMSVADLVISRAGSGTIHEIALHGKPSILIPIPESVSHDQRSNAYAYARTGAAVVIEEGNLHDGILIPEIFRIMKNPEVYATLQAGAREFAQNAGASRVVEIIKKIVDEHY